MSTEWCGPTAEVSNQSLARLLSRARRTSCAPAQKRPTDSSAPLTDPWFEDSQPVPAPEVDPSKPVELPRERKERTSIPKLVTGPVYPIYRGGNALRVVLLLVVLGAAIAALLIV